MSTPESGWPLRRIVLVPLALFAVVSGTVLALALLHLAKPSLPAGASVRLGDAYRGETVFLEACASCHGEGGAGGGVGPPLAGASISLVEAKAQIENGGGAMPAGLASGREEEDVLAYLSTILAP